LLLLLLFYFYSYYYFVGVTGINQKSTTTTTANKIINQHWILPHALSKGESGNGSSPVVLRRPASIRLIPSS